MEIIGVASDHAGYDLKCLIIDYLEKKGYIIKDFGCNSPVSCDYPDFAHYLGYAIDNKEITRGIVFCGSGNGINMTINKHQGVRSALCWNTEITLLARQHNDANVLSLPARFVTEKDSMKMVDIFLNEPFEGGRHLIRIQKIPLPR
jgi:ribose 5-phosphate isomerase B